jgi:hypothetical protein
MAFMIRFKPLVGAWQTLKTFQYAIDAEIYLSDMKRNGWDCESKIIDASKIPVDPIRKSCYTADTEAMAFKGRVEKVAKKVLTTTQSNVKVSVQTETHTHTKGTDIMATDKTFTVAGVATKNGVVHVRWANDLLRVKMLEKDGQTDVRLVELGSGMTKVEAVTFLAAHETFQDEVAQGAFAEYLADSEPKAPKAPKVKAEKAPKTSKKSKKADAEAAAIAEAKAFIEATGTTEVVADVTEDENEPF